MTPTLQWFGNIDKVYFQILRLEGKTNVHYPKNIWTFCTIVYYDYDAYSKYAS